MIVRYWRGWTSHTNADAYQEIVSETVLPSIAARSLAGYHGAYLLRREFPCDASAGLRRLGGVGVGLAQTRTGSIALQTRNRDRAIPLALAAGGGSRSRLRSVTLGFRSCHDRRGRMSRSPARL
jgi:hypothetical protein